MAAALIIKKLANNRPEIWTAKNLRVLDKSKRLVPFMWNKAQLDFHYKRTGRDLLLKARQLGFSTYVQGEIFRRVCKSTRTTITLAHDADTTQKLRLMADRFWENYQVEGKRIERKFANAAMTTYPKNNSVVSVATAGALHAGRGDTYTDFHGSEVAFWPDAEKIVTGAMQGGNPDAILESTPNGAQGYFYELCMEAIRGHSIWKLHFYPWWWDNEYRISPEEVGEKFTHQSYDDEEKELIKKHNLTFEQIIWRRFKKAELKGMFIQEYPEDPITCFLTSGNSYFGNTSQCFNAEMNPKYNPDFTYAAGLDWGQSNDYTAMPILCRETKSQVDLTHVNKLEWKEIRKRIGSTLLTKWSHMICANSHLHIGIWDAVNNKIYDKCPKCGAKIIKKKTPKLGAEKNSIGSVNIEALMDMGIKVFPFEMNNESKAYIMSELYEALHTYGWQLQDHPVQRHEINTFVSTQLPSGIWRLAAEGDGHDDTVIGLGIAYYAITVPMQIF